MTEVRFSVFGHARDNQPQIRTMTWDEFVSGLGPHRFDIAEKKKCPMFSPAEFRPGMARLAEYVTRVWFGVLDLDMITNAQLLSICEKLERHDAVLYTTWNHPEVYTASLKDPRPHRRGLWKIRVCVRLSRPIEVIEWPSFWLAMTAYFDGLNDTNCKDPCRPYFGAFAPPGTPLDLCHFIKFTGDAFDVSALTTQAFTAPHSGVEKVPRDRLKRIALKWRRARDSYRSEMGETLMRVYNGETFAEVGNRDTILFQVCSDLARELPHADPVSIAAHFAQSLQISGPDAPTEELVRDKFERAQATTAAEDLAREMSAVAESRLYIRAAFAKTDPTRDYPYTSLELDAAVESLRCTRDDLIKRWLIQRGPMFYVLGPEAVYSPAYSDKDVCNAALRDLAPAISAGVTLWTETDNGKMRKGTNQLMAEYGSVATEYVLDLTVKKSFYDPAQKLFIQAPCPIRDLVPTWDPEVAKWLEILAGPDHHQNLLNWLAYVTDLHLTCASLFITGLKDTGKSLFAYGVSRLWTENGPTKLVSAMGDFNDMIASCPLLFADEKLPTDFRGRGRTAEIRELLADRSRHFKKKHIPDSSIRGAIRLIVAANNDDVLAIQEHLSIQDIQAIADRFYHFRVCDEAADFLRQVDTDRFVEGDAIAKC